MALVFPRFPGARGLAGTRPCLIVMALVAALLLTRGVADADSGTGSPARRPAVRTADSALQEAASRAGRTVLAYEGDEGEEMPVEEMPLPRKKRRGLYSRLRRGRRKKSRARRGAYGEEGDQRSLDDPSELDSRASFSGKKSRLKKTGDEDQLEDLSSMHISDLQSTMKKDYRRDPVLTESKSALTLDGDRAESDGSADTTDGQQREATDTDTASSNEASEHDERGGRASSRVSDSGAASGTFSTGESSATSAGTTAANENAALDTIQPEIEAAFSEMMSDQDPKSKNAYVTSLYVGTPRDFEFFVGMRVMLQSIKKAGTSADLVVIAGLNTPIRWINTLKGDGVRVILAADLKNPFNKTLSFNPRSRYAINKLLAWRLTEYTRVVLLDADNIILQNVDELFLCGDFCAVFIDPCTFHTGLFVAKPSKRTFRDMMKQLASSTSFQGASQGFLTAYYSELLASPLFQPPPNASAAVADRSLRPLRGLYRLPMGYQLDAFYFNIKFRWLTCSDNKVVTFPGSSDLKPWYWWSWPILALPLQWHNWRLSTIGYAWEFTAGMVLVAFWSIILFGDRLLAALLTLLRGQIGLGPKGPSSPSVAFGSSFRIPGIVVPLTLGLGPRFGSWVRVLLVFVSIPVAALISFSLIPSTIHTVLGWTVLYLGTFALLRIARRLLHAPVALYWIPGFAAAVTVVAALPIYTSLGSKLLVLHVLAFGGGAMAVLVFQSVWAHESSRDLKGELVN